MQPKILVIDDDLSILEVVKIILEDQGYFVITNSNGIGLEEVITSYKPDLVLLDIWMAKNSGENITLTLKSRPDTKNIPVILVSANNDTETIAKKCGADDFLPKPFDITDLVKKIQKYTVI